VHTHIADIENGVEQNHWSERGRVTSVANADALGRTRRSVLALDRTTRMARLLPFGLWSSATLGVVALALIAGYAARNSAGHTGWEPLTALGLFVPLAITGAVCFAMRHRFTGIARASVCALAVGLAGVALIIALDRANRLVQYDRWIHRGMP
jgi:hypothetical protein